MHKGFARQKSRKDKSLYVIFCHKAKTFKDKENYCGFSFLAKCLFDKNSAEWFNPGNWTYVQKKKSLPDHRFISTESVQLNKNLKLRLKANSCCNVPTELVMINAFNIIYKEKCRSGVNQPIEKAFDELKERNKSQVDEDVAAQIMSSNARHNKHVQKTKLMPKDTDIIHDLPKHCRFIDGIGKFYDENLNSKLEHQKFFMVKSEEVDELLKETTVFSFDGTFSVSGFTQLAVLTAHVPNADPFRQKTAVPCAFGFEKSKEKQCYEEFFESFKEMLKIL